MSQPSTAGVSLFSGLRRTLERQPLAPVLPATAARAHLRAVSLPPQQLGDVGGDAPGLRAVQPVWSHRQQAIDLGQGPAVRLVIDCVRPANGERVNGVSG